MCVYTVPGKNEIYNSNIVNKHETMNIHQAWNI